MTCGIGWWRAECCQQTGDGDAEGGESYTIAKANLASVVALPLSFFFQAEDGIRDLTVTGVQTCALPILRRVASSMSARISARIARHSGTYQRYSGWPSDSASASNLEISSSARAISPSSRSEERRVGKECRSGWSPQQ